MLRSVLHFGNPARLSLGKDQLVIDRPGHQQLTRPLEDIGFMVIDHEQVSCSTPLMVRAAELGLVIILCDDKHMPCAYSSPIVGNTLQNLRHRQQWEAGAPMFKQVWRQIVKSKLENQADILGKIGQENAKIRRLAKEVKSGDPENLEGQAAKYYWKMMFPSISGFVREREGNFPNNWLNYGYALIRAAMARSLAGAGLCLSLGIFHHNQYNPYCLADDCMEPYRPWVDYWVWNLIQTTDEQELIPEIKAELLSLLHSDVRMGEMKRPLMVSMDSFAASLAGIFAKESDPKELKLPVFP